jgi:CubicO group peptidase (beta-lactamase class C family)
MDDFAPDTRSASMTLDGIPDEADTRTDTAETRAERDFRRANPRAMRRINDVPLIDDVIVFPGPVFDRFAFMQRLLLRMEASGAVGYSWALVQNGRLIDAGGVGDARTPAETPPREMDERTRMVSASLAKPICAVAVMKLVEDGVLNLGEPAYPHIAGTFPGGHSSLDAVTIEHLLTHTSGYDGPGRLSQFPGTLSNSLTGTTGTSQKYENWNYWFLALVIEAVTGRPYADFARDRVLLPMSINNMTREVDDEAPCLYYALDPSTGGTTWGDFTATAIGAYGWFGNAIHYAKFLAHFRNDTVLSGQTRQQMLNWHRSYFGFRLWQNGARGKYYGHGGDFGRGGGRDFHGGMMGFPDGIDAVLLTNSPHAPDPEDVLIDAYHAAYS